MNDEEQKEHDRQLVEMVMQECFKIEEKRFQRLQEVIIATISKELPKMLVEMMAKEATLK
jgi:hypothetical protein